MDPHSYASKTTRGRPSRSMRRCSTSIPTWRSCRSSRWPGSPRPDHWEFELRPGVTLPRRHAVHRRGRRLQHRARARRDIRFPRLRRRHRGGRGDRRSHRPHHDHRAGPVAVAEARRRGHHVEGLGTGARRNETRRFRRGARGDLRLAPRQWHRAVRARIVRAARRLGHGPQSRLVGHGRLPAQHRPRRSRPRKPIPRTSPPCSRARSICSRPRPTGPSTRSAATRI